METLQELETTPEFSLFVLEAAQKENREGRRKQGEGNNFLLIEVVLLTVVGWRSRLPENCSWVNSLFARESGSDPVLLF